MKSENSIDEIESLRKVVITKHFPNYYWIMTVEVDYHGDREQGYRLQHAIDEKVIYYMKLNISADDLVKTIPSKKYPRNWLQNVTS